MIPRTSCCSSSTIWSSSTSTMSASAPFHVKDAEFNPTGKQGVYSGFQNWTNRAGRFRSLGDGQVDFGAIFSKLARTTMIHWAVLEWECCIKDAAQGAKEGRALHREPHHQNDGESIRRFRRRQQGHRQSPCACWGWNHRRFFFSLPTRGREAGVEMSREMTMVTGTREKKHRPHPPRHGGWRAGGLHRRCASPRRPHG
jgi:hypothetical protein